MKEPIEDSHSRVRRLFQIRSLKQIFVMSQLRSMMLGKYHQRIKHNIARRSKPARTSQTKITLWLRPRAHKDSESGWTWSPEERSEVSMGRQTFDLHRLDPQLQGERLVERGEVDEKEVVEHGDQIGFVSSCLNRAISLGELKIAREALRPEVVSAEGESGRIEVQAGIVHFYDSQKFTILKNNLILANEKIENVQSQIQRIEQDLTSGSASSSCIVLQCSKLIKQFEQQRIFLQQQISRLEDDKNNKSQQYQFWFRYSTSHLATKNWPTIEGHLSPLTLIGFGGFSQVYLCYNQRQRSLAAVKLAIDNRHRYRELGDNTFYQTWKEQCRIQSLFNHPNVCKMLGYFVTDESDYISVLEVYSGPTLFDHIRSRSFLPEHQAKPIIRQILAGLEHIHSKGVIHFDLKTKNIMLHNGVVKIIDFGISKQLPQGQSEMRLDDDGTGTYSYLPLEALDTDQMISTKVDIFSLGVVFYEMLYGCKPWNVSSQIEAYLVYSKLEGKRIEFPNDKCEVSEMAKEFIWKCLELDGKDRYSTEQAIASDYMRD